MYTKNSGDSAGITYYLENVNTYKFRDNIAGVLEHYQQPGDTNHINDQLDILTETLRSLKQPQALAKNSALAAPVLPAQKQLAKIQKLEDQLAKLRQTAQAEENAYAEYRQQKTPTRKQSRAQYKQEIRDFLNIEADVHADDIERAEDE